MSTVAPPPAAPKPRRLNFSKSDPNPTDPVTARAKRKAKPEPFKAKPNRRPRLPHGSRFSDIVFDANTVTWSGTLTVPNCNPFKATAGAVMTLLSVLDEKYRATLR